jgi:aminoglycoside 3-N-acetyltransferase I
MYLIKRLTSSDTELCRQLLSIFQVAFEEEVNSKSVSDEYLKSVLGMDTTIVLVATDSSGDVVGGILAYELRKINREQSEIYLYDLAVAEPHRRKGIATQLINELKSIGTDIGAGVIFVQADNVDTEAVTLYTKLSSSIEKDITHFDIDVK